VTYYLKLGGKWDMAGFNWLSERLSEHDVWYDALTSEIEVECDGGDNALAAAAEVSTEIELLPGVVVTEFRLG
jgi:hypothetical protein